MAKAKKPGTVEAWERGNLGENLESAKVVSVERTEEIQEAAGMQLISIRLPKSVIEDFKAIAQIEGLGYQPLMRTALVRFAESEAKRVVRDYAAQVRNEKKLTKVTDDKLHSRGGAPDNTPHLERKVA